MDIIDLINQSGIDESNDRLERIEKKIDTLIQYLHSKEEEEKK